MVKKKDKTSCDHYVRKPNGLVYTFRNICEICGKNMRNKETPNEDDK